jgi:transposase
MAQAECLQWPTYWHLSSVFDEAEMLAADTTAAQDSAPLSPESGKGKPAAKPARDKRAPLPSELKRVDVLASAAAIAASTSVVIPIRAVSDDTERLFKPTTYRKY